MMVVIAALLSNSISEHFYFSFPVEVYSNTFVISYAFLLGKSGSSGFLILYITIVLHNMLYSLYNMALS